MIALATLSTPTFFLCIVNFDLNKVSNNSNTTNKNVCYLTIMIFQTNAFDRYVSLFCTYFKGNVMILSTNELPQVHKIFIRPSMTFKMLSKNEYSEIYQSGKSPFRLRFHKASPTK